MIHIRFEDQDRDSFLTYELDFQARAEEEGSPIIAITWDVPVPDGDLDPLSVSSYTNVDALGVPVAPGAPIAASRVRVAGGTEGNDYRVRATLVFANGGIEPVSFHLRIGET